MSDVLVLQIALAIIPLVYLTARVAGAGWFAAKLRYNDKYFKMMYGEKTNEAR